MLVGLTAAGRPLGKLAHRSVLCDGDRRYGDGDATTSIAPTGTGLTSSSGYRVKVATVAGETGYRFAFGTLTATPSLGTQFSHVERGWFAETGSILALTGPEAHYDRQKVWAGQVSRKPSMSAAWC